jgi:ketosteroid isomerase-like protein
MSQENVDVGRRMLQAFNDGDVEAIVAECDPAVEWEEQSIPGVEPLYRGHEGVRRWAAAVLGVREELGPPPRALGGSQGGRRYGDRLCSL